MLFLISGQIILREKPILVMPDKSLEANDWLKASQFLQPSNESILNGEDCNAWNFVTNLHPVVIDNQIYLFPK